MHNDLPGATLAVDDGLVVFRARDQRGEVDLAVPEADPFVADIEARLGHRRQGDGARRLLG